MKATQLSKGLGVKLDGKLFFLTEVEHRTPGNLRAFIQIKAKDVLKGNTIERRLGSSDDVEVVDLDRRPMEYLYSDNTGATTSSTTCAASFWPMGWGGHSSWAMNPWLPK
jgi:elongation factor P